MRIRLLGLFCISARVLAAATWRLPLPPGPGWQPLADLPVWVLPGVYADVEASCSGLRNTAARDICAGHAVKEGLGLARADGVLRLYLEVAGRADTAVWVGLGEDTLDPNGVLDSLECRLLLGLDRGRWGLRQCARGETVWAAAHLPPDGGACSLEVSLDSATGQLLGVTVDDGDGIRHPEALAQFNPGWGGLFSSGMTNWWRAVRIETRGLHAELRDLRISFTAPSLLIVR